MEDDDRTKISFLIDSYKSRIDFFSKHADRTWTRFNILLTVELAIGGVFFAKLFDSRPLMTPHLWMPAVLGTLVSALWYVFGAQDRCAYLGFREQISWLEETIIKYIPISDFPKFDSSGTKRHDLFTWRAAPISLSKLISIVPLALLLAWLIALGFLVI